MNPQDITRLFQEITALQQKIDALNVKPAKVSFHSYEIKDIAAALAKAQGEYPSIGSNRENPHFKSAYTDLNQIMRVIRPVLAKYGLAISQIPITDEGVTTLYTRLWHSTGQWIESALRVVPMKTATNEIQAFGSALTYYKRYAYMALLGVTVSKDPDDNDCQIEEEEMTPEEIVAEKKYASQKYNEPKASYYEPVTREQLEQLNYELEGYTDLAQRLLKSKKLLTLADLPKTDFLATLERVREIKSKEVK